MGSRGLGGGSGGVCRWLVALPWREMQMHTCTSACRVCLSHVGITVRLLRDLRCIDRSVEMCAAAHDSWAAHSSSIARSGWTVGPRLVPRCETGTNRSFSPVHSHHAWTPPHPGRFISDHVSRVRGTGVVCGLRGNATPRVPDTASQRRCGSQHTRHNRNRSTRAPSRRRTIADLPYRYPVWTLLELLTKNEK